MSDCANKVSQSVSQSGRVFESRGGIITFYLFYLLRFPSHFSL